MNTAIARSFVFGANDRIAPLHEQWQDNLRSQFRDGPDPRQVALDLVVDHDPDAVLEVGAGSGRFAADLGDRLDGFVMVTDPSALLVEQADMRDVRGVVAEATALPLASASFDCVIVHRPQWRDEDVARALRELTRVLTHAGMLVLSVGSPRVDGHELDELLGYTLRRRAVGLTSDTALDALASRFDRVEQTRLDHAMVFSSGAELANYLRASPARRALADQVRELPGPFRLTYDVRLVVATTPRRQDGQG